MIEDDGRPEVIARAQTGLGLLAFESGEHEQAIEFLEQGLGDRPANLETAVAADRLGRAYALTGCFEEALALFNRYLAAAKDREDSLDTIRFSVLLANTQIDRCDYAAAETVLSGVLEQARGAADPAARAGIYWAQSHFHLSQDEPELAGRYARMALSILEQTEHTGYIATALLLLAMLANDRGDSTEALELLEQAAPVVQASGNRCDIRR